MPGTQLTVYIAPINTVNIGQKGGTNNYDFSNITFTDTTIFSVDSLTTMPELINRYSSKSILWGAYSESERQNNHV